MVYEMIPTKARVVFHPLYVAQNNNMGWNDHLLPTFFPAISAKHPNVRSFEAAY